MAQQNSDTSAKDEEVDNTPDDSDAEAALKIAEDRSAETPEEKTEIRTLAHSGDPSVTNPKNAKLALAGKEAPPTPTAGTPAAQPDSITQNIINRNKHLQELQEQGRAAGNPLLEQAAQTQVTPEQLQGNRNADVITRALQIGDQGIRAASATKNKTYESPASQKIYDEMIAQRQKDLTQQQAVSNSLQQRGLAAQAAPLQSAEALQQAQAEGTKVETGQALAPIEVGKAALGLKNAQQTAPLEVQRMQNLVSKETLDWKKENEDLNEQDRPLTSTEIKGWQGVGVPLRAGATVRDINNAYKLGGLQVRETVGANKLGLQTEKMDTAQANAASKAYDADKTVQGANLAVTNASELKRLANMTDNEVAQSGAQLLKARTLLGNARMSQFFAGAVGMQSYAGRMQNLIDLKAKGQMSPEQQRELNQLADDTVQEAQRQLKERSDYFSNQYSNKRTSAEALKPKLTGQPAAALAPADQQALDWANANPDDPRAKQIKAHLGQ